MANLDISNIKDYDIMQHIRNIYNIIGATTPEGINASSTLVSAIDKVAQESGQKIWVGTQERYEEGVGNGTITNTMLCIITDDYYEPTEEDILKE